MSRLIPVLALVVLAEGAAAGGGPVRMVVADVPYARVWAAVQEALREYPIERAADGELVTGWRERAPHAEETGVERVAERITLQVEPFGEGITRITVLVELQGLQAGQWVTLEERGPASHEVLARVRAALS